MHHKRKNVIIIGAAGRDFHNFNTYYRKKPITMWWPLPPHRFLISTEENTLPNWPVNCILKGIPIYAQDELPRLIKEHDVDICAFSYSDVSYQQVMAVSAIVNAAGADFLLIGPKETMMKSTKPVIAVGAIRTGCGKSQTSRRIIEVLMEHGIKVVAIRHPMPYGDLVAQKVQRFATIEDLAKAQMHHRRDGRIRTPCGSRQCDLCRCRL
jgi:predicted GTPase